MNKLFMTFVLSIFSMPLFAQINMADSTAQVISYWNVGDKQSYDIVTQKLKIEEGDTTSNEIVTYEVNITVLDSTENSYTVEWFYHNYQTNSEVEFMRKCIELSNNLKVIIELDKYGTFTISADLVINIIVCV